MKIDLPALDLPATVCAPSGATAPAPSPTRDPDPAANAADPASPADPANPANIAWAEQLSAAFARSADEQASLLAPLSWSSRCQRLAQAALSWNSLDMDRGCPFGATGFIAAVLQRWGHHEVADPYQACLYLLSTDPGHRAMAVGYLVDNPEMRELITAELTGEPELGGKPREGCSC